MNSGMNPGELIIEPDLDSINPLPESATTLAPTSPGSMLKKAREAMQLSQQQIADRLKLTLDKIVQIERDDFSRTTAFIYLRGYLKAYSKLVNLPDEKVLSAFDSLGLTEPDRQQLLSNTKPPVQKQKHGLNFQNNHGKLAAKIAGGVVVLLALITVFNWWHHKLNPSAQATNLIQAKANPNAIALTPMTTPTVVTKVTPTKITPAKTLPTKSAPIKKTKKITTKSQPAIVNEKIYYHTVAPNDQ